MSTSGINSPRPSPPPPAPTYSPEADRAYRRAWWSLALYPVSFVAAFVIGEGLASVLGGDSGSLVWWEALLAAAPAILVFVLPGVLAVHFGRRAVRLGRADGRTPAIIGAVIGLGFVALNLASGVLMLLFG
ncbi:hypothetical protein [Angustibacter sp. Root456]|uniref:hypothetical protein n=1 Tax=Angustibacter sp. Root456 TaxID=1736539 RepID=UPI0006FFAD07|nr:hypothetical protein [Angustibacter sp. Root456]KQX65699.1 hypothetical protein ASD06_08710 [Angustibacter sp. Root456]